MPSSRASLRSWIWARRHDRPRCDSVVARVLNLLDDAPHAFLEELSYELARGVGKTLARQGIVQVKELAAIAAKIFSPQGVFADLATIADHLGTRRAARSRRRSALARSHWRDPRGQDGLRGLGDAR